jgi:hypothetical protein
LHHQGSLFRDSGVPEPTTTWFDPLAFPLLRRGRGARHYRRPQQVIEPVEDRRLAPPVGAQRFGRQPVAQVILELAPFDAAVLVAVGGERPEQPELVLASASMSTCSKQRSVDAVLSPVGAAEPVLRNADPDTR